MGMKGNLAAALAQAMNEDKEHSGITEGKAGMLLARAFAIAGTAGCFVKAKEDEPIFVLRAQDRTAPRAVREWAERAKGAGMADQRFTEAMDCALSMEEWGKHNRTKIPD